MTTGPRRGARKGLRKMGPKVARMGAKEAPRVGHPQTEKGPLEASKKAPLRPREWTLRTLRQSKC